MFNYIQTSECFISDITIGYPTCHLCLKFYVQFVMSTVKSRQISNVHTHGFLLKCENHLILATDQSKSPKNNKNIELELLLGDQQMTKIANSGKNHVFEKFSLAFITPLFFWF